MSRSMKCSPKAEATFERNFNRASDMSAENKKPFEAVLHNQVTAFTQFRQYIFLEQLVFDYS